MANFGLSFTDSGYSSPRIPGRMTKWKTKGSWNSGNDASWCSPQSSCARNKKRMTYKKGCIYTYTTSAYTTVYLHHKINKTKVNGDTVVETE